MSIEAMKQALETLDVLWGIIDDIDTIGDISRSDDKAYRSLVERKQRTRFAKTGITTDGYTLEGGSITALRQAIKQAEKQEPVAWVGLTDTEIAIISGYVWENNLWDENTFARAIEAKLKEKNHE